MSALKKVLVVDDDPVVSKSFDRVLARKGYLVVSAENGQEALDKALAENFDAVFTDIKMPGMSGIEVAERMQARQPWTPVVIITGYGSDESQARAEAAGVKGFVRKPLSPEMIETSLDAAIATAVQPAAKMLPQAAIAAAVDAEASRDVSVARFVKNLAMFFAAPFVGLAYIALFPLIGLGMLVGMAVRALYNVTFAESSRARSAALFVKNIALFFAAPFIGLAYVALFPLIGLGMLVGMAARTWHGRRALG
jgi:CheY-like chemotaxis protein